MTALRTLVAVGIAAVLFAVLLPELFGTPPLVYTGISRLTDRPLSQNSIRVERGSPAYNAGLRTGDVVSCLSVRDRQVLFPRFGFAAYPSAVIHLCAQRAQRWRRVAFVPAPRPTYGYLYYTIPLTIVRLAVYAVFLITGIALVLARPTLLTWLLYIFCVSSGPYYALTTYGTGTLPASVYTFFFPLNIMLTALGVVSLALFALCVPNDGVPQGWRRTAFIIISIAAVIPLFDSAAHAFWTSIDVPAKWSPLIDALFTGAAVLIVLARLLEVRGEERARLSWVAFALIWGVSMNTVRNNVGVYGTLWESISTWAADATVVMPIVMMYAILKRHVIDVRFVISRTVVYACLTTLIVAVIGAVDWLTSAYLTQVRLAMAIDAAVTIGIAFVLHRAYRWIESAVDFMLFRRKHDAQRYLERVAHTLLFAQHEDAVDKALVHDPFDKLRLTAAAIYRLSGDTFTPARTEGWSALSAPQFCSDDDLVRFMLAERVKISVSDLRSHVAEPFRMQGHAPAVAIPIFQGNRLTGFVLYGIHRDGTKLDPDEIETLEHLCAAAAQAYTGIELARYQAAETPTLLPALQ